MKKEYFTSVVCDAQNVCTLNLGCLKPCFHAKLRIMSQWFILLLIVWLSIACQNLDNSQDKHAAEYSHYDIQLKIDPEKQTLKVIGSLKYFVDEDSLNKIVFNLHKQLKIHTFRVRGSHSFTTDSSGPNLRWLPDAIKWVYQPTESLRAGDVVKIDFSYGGKITKWPPWSANVIGPEWVEMGLYFPWYPSFSGLFTYKLSVDTEPEYRVFAIGTPSTVKNKKVFKTRFPVDDFIVCASRDLTIRETDLLDRSFTIVDGNLSGMTLDSIQTDIERVHHSYTQWFGTADVNDMCLVVSKREKGGGYSRKGGLFLGGMSDSGYFTRRTDYIRYLSHELAHLWWNGAAHNWEDWLNESFAEYSAMMIIREWISEKAFHSRLEKKESESIHTPPIWGVRRDSPSAEAVLYSKGVVLLHELEEKIGPDQFLALCKTRMNENINNTSDFLNTINRTCGADIADWFEQSLKNR